MALGRYLFALTAFVGFTFGFNPFHRDHVVPPSGAEEKASCHMTSAYPPPDSTILPEFVIDLDSAPEHRWAEPIGHFKKEINKLLDLVTGSSLVSKVTEYLDRDVDEYLDLFPKDWGKELRGIAAVLDADIGDVFLYNIAYELFGLCTSIVAQDATGHVYHGRNLDFGLWPNFNFTDFQWGLTGDLRDILFNVNFTRSGEVLYRSTVFGGYIGVLTAVKKGALSISVDTRFDHNFDRFLLKYLRNPSAEQQWLSLTTRMAIEEHSGYEDAVAFIANTSFIGPCYVIVGGVKKNEGAVLTVGPNKSMFDRWDLGHGLPVNGTEAPFFVLETNYDHWDEPPFFDDRRYPAERCMEKEGAAKMGWETLYNVLHGKPNRNRLTTYTTLMDTATGGYVAYKQYCTDWDCSPW